ncbi:hypothetical protein [Thermostilla marina]
MNEPKPKRHASRVRNALRRAIVAGLVGASLAWSVSSHRCAAEKWHGVDETVVERFAESAGRAPADPLLNTDQGDLLLFVFLIAGTIGGFIAGYSWASLFPINRDSTDE